MFKRFVSAIFPQDRCSVRSRVENYWCTLYRNLHVKLGVLSLLSSSLPGTLLSTSFHHCKFPPLPAPSYLPLTHHQSAHLAVPTLVAAARFTSQNRVPGKQQPPADLHIQVPSPGKLHMSLSASIINAFDIPCRRPRTYLPPTCCPPAESEDTLRTEFREKVQ